MSYQRTVLVRDRYGDWGGEPEKAVAVTTQVLAGRLLEGRACPPGVTRQP